MATVTLKQIRDAVNDAHGWCNYYHTTNETIGPYSVSNLNGPTTSCKYDHRRSWDTKIAVALAEEEFGVDLSHHHIIDEGPWRDTIKSLHAAVNHEIQADAEFEIECA